MNTKIKAGVAALLAVGSIAASSVPANAEGHWGGGGGWHGREGWGGRGYEGDRGYGGGAVLGAGIVGLALGAALSGNHYGYGYGPSYGYGYAPRHYGYGYETCVVRREVWDPYFGGYVVRRVPVPC